VLLTLLAPLGDLVESLFKRDAGIKDSSGLIPATAASSTGPTRFTTRRRSSSRSSSPRTVAVKRLAVLGSTGSIGTPRWTW